jgi:RTX toxins and related Ca2+-binding proteins
LVFKAGVSRADVVCERQFDDLLFRIKSTGDAILVTNGYRGNELQLTAVEFADGSKLDIAELNGLRNQVSGSGIVEGYNGDDILHGMDSNDILVAYEGNDELYGGAGDDQLDGFSGNDKLYGEAGNDILHGGAGDDYLSGGIGNDALAGGTGNDQLDGGAGDDLLDGEEGNDSYLFGIGDGKNTITDTNGENSLLLKSGVSVNDIMCIADSDDLIITIKSTGDSLRFVNALSPAHFGVLKSMRFADGLVMDIQDILSKAGFTVGDEKNNIIDASWSGEHILLGNGGDDELTGTQENDFIDGGSGNDYLYGGYGDDVYIYGEGSGNDIIHEHSISYTSAIENNTLQFKQGITVADVLISRNMTDLVLTLKNTGEKVTIASWFEDKGYVFNNITFSDGSVLDIKSIDKSLRTINGDEKNNQITGTLYSDIIYGLDGDDTLRGDLGDDYMSGGHGNDVLIGGYGNDTYLFSRGDGKDTIQVHIEDGTMYRTGEYNNDRLVFGPGITASDLFYAKGNSGPFDDNLIIGIKGTNDQVTIKDGMSSDYNNRLSTVELSDGTVLDMSGHIKELSTKKGTSESDWLSGDLYIDNILLGLDGNDTLWGVSGGKDTLDGGSGDDELYGFGRNDILDGGAGNDQLYGGQGDDIYKFGRGDGQDRIYNQDSFGLDVLQFKDGISADQLWFQSSSDFSLTVSIIGTNDNITINGWYLDRPSSSTGEAIDFFKLSNGKMLRESQVQNLVAAMSSLTPPAAGQTTLSADYHSKLDAVIAANWK